MAERYAVSPDQLMLEARWVRRLAKALVGDEDVADDLAQETIIIALRRPPAEGGALRPWLRGILLNVLYKHRRAHGRRRKYEEKAETTGGLPSSEALLESIQMQKALAETLERLSEPFRTTLTLRYMHDLPCAEIARRQNLPASTVRSRLALGLEQMRRRLDHRTGNRERWRALILPLARPIGEVTPLALWWASGSAGALVAKVGVAAAVVLVLAFVVVSRWHTLGRGEAGGTARQGRATASASGSTSTRAAGHPPDPHLVRTGQLRPVGDVDDGRGETSSCPLPTARAPAAELHPRVLVAPERICEIRAALQRPGSRLHELFADLKARVDADRPERFGARVFSYGRARQAMAAAFVYLVTADRRYAKHAFRAIEQIYEDPGPEALPDVGTPLARAVVGSALALVYDWAYAGLDVPERQALSVRLDDALTAWSRQPHKRVSAPWESSWVAAAGGAEVLQILARGGHRGARLMELKGILRQHLRSYGSMGMHPEGIEKLVYAGAIFLPAVHALRAAGDDELFAALRDHQFWRLAMFAGANAVSQALEERSIWLATGVGPADVEDGGWATLLIPTVPRDRLPAYLGFHERHARRPVPGRSGETRFEPYGVSAVWALLFTPRDVRPADPTATVGVAAADETDGAYFFRNRWLDGDDVQVVMLADARATSGQHLPDTADALQIRIRGMGASFAGGAAHLSRQYRGHSTLLVDGTPFRHRASTGARGVFEPSAQGGYAIADGGGQYQALGVSGVRRHLLVDFSGAAGVPAFIATLDRVTASTAHQYTFQLNLGDHAGDGGLHARSGVEDGCPVFTVTGPDGAYLKGWVLGPGGATVEAADPLQVRVAGADVDIWVAMVIGRGEPPRAAIAGDGLESELRVGGAALVYDGAADRIRVLPR